MEGQRDGAASNRVGLMSTEDLPMISPSNDSTQVELSPQKEVRVNAPEPRRNPTTQVPKAAPAAPAGPAPARPAAVPGVSAARPIAPAVRAPIPAAPAAGAGDDEDPEKLLREYADRQKTKVVRLEQQLVEYKKVVGERDALRAKVESLTKELQDAKRQVEASGKSEEMIRDLQGKVDAAVLSNSILAEDKEKLKKGLSQQTDHFTKAQERAEQAEKSLAEAQDQLVKETQGREEAEAKVLAALKALESDASPVRSAPKAISEAVTRPMKPVAAEPPAPKAEPAKDERAATPPPPNKPGGQGPHRPPSRFSFLKK